MNYYPYFSSIPYAAPIAKAGLFKSLAGGLNWGSIISGTQKTLGIVNQAIPLIKQAGPVINNAKTMFKVMNEFKKSDNQVNQKDIVNQTNTVNKNNNEAYSSYENNTGENIVSNTSNSNSPTFFQ